MTGQKTDYALSNGARHLLDLMHAAVKDASKNDGVYGAYERGDVRARYLGTSADGPKLYWTNTAGGEADGSREALTWLQQQVGGAITSKNGLELCLAEGTTPESLLKALASVVSPNDQVIDLSESPLPCVISASRGT